MKRQVENSLCLPLQTNPGARAGSSGEGERVSYRLRVIKALVQRYIETARREFEETRRKGQWFTCNAPRCCSWLAWEECAHPDPPSTLLRQDPGPSFLP